MKTALLIHAILWFCSGVLLLGALLFGFAGTLHYPGAWLFLSVLFIPMFLMGVVLFFKAPQLLEKRLKHRESDPSQRSVIALSGVLFTVMFAVCGLDFRFGWSQMPKTLSYAAAAIHLLSYAMYAEVMRENAFLSRTIEVQDNQTVVDTGLYGIVRHPMYSATVLMFCAMPLVLGSYPGFFVMLLYPALIVKRILGEEAYLKANLDGYEDYTTRVRFRLLPPLW